MDVMYIVEPFAHRLELALGQSEEILVFGGCDRQEINARLVDFIRVPAAGDICFAICVLNESVPDSMLGQLCGSLVHLPTDDVALDEGVEVTHAIQDPTTDFDEGQGVSTRAGPSSQCLRANAQELSRLFAAYKSDFTSKIHSLFTKLSGPRTALVQWTQFDGAHLAISQQ